MPIKVIGQEPPKDPNEETKGPAGIRVLDSPPVPPKTSTMEALGEGFSQGLSYNAADELAAQLKGREDRLEGESVEQAIQRNLQAHQESLKAAQEEHPVAYYGSQVAGGVAGSLLPWQAKSRAGGAIQGGVEGAIQGGMEGTTPTERVTGGALGAVGGTIGGALSPELGRVGAFITHKLGKHVWDALAPIIGGPGGARKVAQALEQAGVSPEEAERIILGAQSRGQNATLGDVGQQSTGRLGQTSGSINPAAQQAIQELTDERNADRVGRFRDFMFKEAPGMGTAASERDILRSNARAANKTNYDAAYKAAPDVWDQELIDMTTSPAVRQAIKDVETKSANRAVAEGGKTSLQQPFKFDPATGEATLKDPNMRPSLEFWDHVQRNLREQEENAGKGFFGGKSAEATDIGDIRRNLNTKLDAMSPEFGKARGEALTFFKASDAMDLGQKLASDTGMSSEAFEKGLATLAKMSPPDRRLAQVGYIDALSHRAGTGTTNQDIARTLMGSPNDKAIQRALFTGEAATRMDAFQKAEGMMQLFSGRALGGSQTAQRATDLLRATGVGGLIGGAGGMTAGLYKGDDEKLAGGAGATTGAIAGLIFAGGRSAISQHVATRVAKYLTSSDAADRQTVYKMMSASPAIRDAISAAAGRLGGMLGADLAPDQTQGAP